MKKIVKFAFAVVAMACVVFASASCGKDDEDNDNKNNNGITIPEIHFPTENSISGTSFFMTWSEAKKNGNSKDFVYQVALSDDEGRTWVTYDEQKFNSYEFKGLKSDKIYFAKITAKYSDGTSAESEVRKFVANYSKGLIGASVLTENSITMEWGNLLPYDYVELSISDCYCSSDGFTYVYQNEQPAVKITEGNSYKFNNLTPEGGYAIKYKYVISDKTSISGVYYAMAIDDTKYINDGKFNKIKIIEMNNSLWTIDFISSRINCYGNKLTVDNNLAYGYTPARDNDILDLIKSSGYSDSEIEKHTVEEAQKLDDCTSPILANYIKNGFGTNGNAEYYLTDDNKITCYYFNDEGNFLREIPRELDTFTEYVYKYFLYIKR